MSATTLSAKTRNSKKFKALIAVGFSEDQAAKLVAPKAPKATKPAPKDAAPKQPTPQEVLAAAGFDEDTIAQILNAKSEPEKPATSKEQGEALVEQRGLTFTRGRVYMSKRAIEAAVRVGKTGKPEIVNAGGNATDEDKERYITAVLIYQVEGTGDVAIQNLH